MYRVIFVNRYFHPDVSATSQLLTDLAMHLAGSGLDTYVVTSRLRYEGNGRVLERREQVDGVHVRRVWTTSFGRGGVGRVCDYATFHLFAAIEVARVSRRGDVVVAETDPPLLSIVLAFVCLLRGARLVNWLQDLFPEVLERLSARSWVSMVLAPLRAARNWSLRRARMNVAIGRQMGELVRQGGATEGCMTVIPNWADGDEVAPLGGELNPLRSEWGLNGRFVVGYSGNLGRAHELDSVIDAAELLLQDSRISFLFIGEGHQKERLKAACEARGLTNVQFRTYVPRSMIRLSLTVPDVHVVSLQAPLEGLVVPSKFYGAMAAGVPIIFIGDPNGELGRMVQGAEPFGFAVSPGDAKAFAFGIVRLADNEQLRIAMGNAARQRFIREFDRNVAFAKWLETVHRVAGSL